MQRKLIQLSPSTMVVSLPSAWVRKNNLKKGNEMFVEEQDNKIVVSSSSRLVQKEVTLDVSKLDGKLLWVVINAAYVDGYDSIILLTKDQKQAQYMAKVVQYFPGMIVYDQRKNSVLLKDVAENTAVDVKKMLHRIFFMTISLWEDALDALGKKDWITLADIKKRDYIINSYVAYCFRHVHKFGFVPQSKTGIIHTYIKALEMFADKSCVLFWGIGTEKIATNSTSLAAVLSLYKDLFASYQSFSYDALALLEEKRQKLLAMRHPKQHVQLYVTELAELMFDIEELQVELHT